MTGSPSSAFCRPRSRSDPLRIGTFRGLRLGSGRIGMAEQRTRQDSSRDLLEELEDGWASAPSSKGAAAQVAADSAPDVNDLDEGWLDQLFPEEDEDEEEEEPEPELPDERADPVAFAAAKKAREERQAARKEKKRQKLEAKRARQRSKAAAMRQKQKGKSKRKPAPASEPDAGGTAPRAHARVHPFRPRSRAVIRRLRGRARGRCS